MQTLELLEQGTRELEHALCRHISAEGCVLADSAETGLSLALLAAGVRPGENVMCSAFAPEYTRRSILNIGVTITQVDINPNTFNIDPFCVEYMLSKYSRNGGAMPRALIATDTFGLPCNYSALEAVCEKYGITVIEDMGDAFGATFGGSYAGSLARFAAASVSTPDSREGGVVFCRTDADKALIEEWIRPIPYDAESFVQTSYSEKWIAKTMEDMRHRASLAKIYRRELNSVCRVQQIDTVCESAYTQFAVVLPCPENKAEILDHLAKKEISCGQFEKSGGENPGSLENIMIINAVGVRDKLITLPMNCYLTAHMAERIGRVVADVVRA